MERARALGFDVAIEVATSLLPFLYADETAAAVPPSALVRDLLARGDQLADGLASVVRGVAGPLAEYVEAWLVSRVADVASVAKGVDCVASPGQTATGTAKLVAPSDLSAGRIWVTTLTHPQGACVDSRLIRCIPDGFERLARDTSLPVRIVIDTPADALVGNYVGHLLCSALAREVGAVRLELVPETPAP
jgi:hypothetical protein